MTTPLKNCERCGDAKPATEKYFGLNLRKRDGLKPYCRACGPDVLRERRKRKAEVAKAWRDANPEKVKEIARRSQERNRTDRRAYFRKYRKENAERINEYSRAYAAKKRQALEGQEQHAIE